MTIAELNRHTLQLEFTIIIWPLHIQPLNLSYRVVYKKYLYTVV